MTAWPDTGLSSLRCQRSSAANKRHAYVSGKCLRRQTEADGHRATADQTLHVVGLRLGEIESTRANLVQQPQLDQLVGACPNPLHCGGERVVLTHSCLESVQRRSRLEDGSSLAEPGDQFRTQRPDAREFGEHSGQLGTARSGPSRHHVDGLANAEETEPIEQLCPLHRHHGQRRIVGEEVVGREEQQLAVVLGQVGDLAEAPEFRFAQGGGALRKKPRHGNDRLAEPTQLGVIAVSGGDPTGRIHRIEPSSAEFVGPREHSDGVDRAGMGQVVVVERLEKPDVAAVQVSHEVDDSVSLCRHLVVRGQGTERPQRHIREDRIDPGCVDQRDFAKASRRPFDVQTLDVGLGQAVQVDVERSVLPCEAH